MAPLILSFDLGTGGVKASLYDESGLSLSGFFVSYETLYPAGGRHEQRPQDWWNAVVESTGRLLADIPDAADGISCISLSGQSLSVVPVDREGKLLRDTAPIWSDTRAVSQANTFFSRIDQKKWYLTTGNGFPPQCYSLFKAMWYRDSEPDMYRNVRWLLGSKDYINLIMTGRGVSDFSYASGSGAYNLAEWRYEEAFFNAAGVDPEIFPESVASTEIIGELRAGSASVLGLRAGIPVVAGGVDNSCMALGAGNIARGRVYTSLGSSAWIAVSSETPVLDSVSRPYVFAHVVPGLFTSAVSIFSAGNSYRWARDVFLGEGTNYQLMDEMAARSPAGANGVLFNPSLAGGSSQEPNPDIRGGFMRLDLRHTRNDLLRAVLEGIALNLGSVLSILKSNVEIDPEMLLVGGGSRSSLWRQILADVFGMRVVKTNVDQDAAALGAAALAAVGTGLWKDFSRIDEIHTVVSVTEPDADNSGIYAELMPMFEKLRKAAAEIGEY